MSSPRDGATDVTELAPLSVAQEALWFVSLLDPKRQSYHETVSIRKSGELDVEALRRAFNEIVRRHEAWRTTFDTVDGEPVQVVHESATFDLPLVDLSELTAEEAERRASGLAAELSRVPYDLRRGPLVRPRLVSLSADEHRLYLAMHHIVFDGVSVYRVVLPELVALYNAFAAGEPSPLAEPETTYADYARWEQQWIGEARAARRLRYWQEHLADHTPLDLPVDRPRPAAPRYRGGVAGVEVPADLVDRLRTVGQSAGATLFHVLAGAWAVLLGRYSGQQDVAFATPADLRQRPEFEGVVGYCLTPLVARVDLSGDPQFGELVGRVRNEMLDAMDNAVPFERVVRELSLEVNGANPVYQSMIVLEPALPAPDPEWSAVMMENEITRAVDATKLDLELQIDERPDGNLVGRLIYDRDLFKAETAERLAERWSRILAAVAADPTVTVSGLVAVTSDEERRQVVEWNATASERPEMSLPDLIRARSAAQSDAPAVSAGRETITYGELESRSEAIATDLRAGAVIALDKEPSVQFVVSALGTLKADDASPAAVLFTKTGKGVAVTHRAAVNAATALADETGLSSADRVVVLPETCVASPITELWAPLMAGAEIILASREESVDGAKLSRLIKRRKATLMHASPQTWQTLIDSKLRPARSLRALSSGGPLPQRLAEALLERFRVLWNAYGTAETAGLATIGPIEPPAAVAVGHPIANTRVYVVDQGGRPVPVGAVGELLVAGIGVADEYVNRPELADDLAATSPDGTRAFRTGDRARWLADGILQIA